MQDWLSYSPWIFIQYILIILLFWLLFFPLKASEGTVAVVMLGVMIVSELLWRNPLLQNPILALPALLLLASIWTFLTFLPFWLLRGLLTSRKVAVAFSLGWLLVAAFLGLITLIAKLENAAA
jgi:hypothetical protein